MKWCRLVTILVSLSVHCADATDLLSVFQEAERYDPTLASAKAAQIAIEERHIQGQALLKPSLSLSTGINQNFGTQTFYNPVESDQSQKSRQLNAAINLSYPLYHPSNRYEAEQGTQAAEQGQLQYSLSQQDLILRVAQAYFDQRIVENTLDALLAQKNAIEEQLKLSKKNFQIGNATIVDTHEAQARFDQVDAQLTAARLDLENKKIAIQNLVGHAIPILNELKTPAILPPLPFKTVEAWLETAQAQHPTILLSQKNVEIARLEYKKSHASEGTTIDLSSQIAINRAQGGDNLTTHYKQNSSSIGLHLSYPLYNGGGLASRSRETASLYDKSLSELSSTRLAVTKNVQQAWNTVQSMDSQIKAFQQALTSSEIVLKSSKRGQEIGLRTTLDVLNAQQLRTQSIRDLTNARYGQLLALLQLHASAGQLNIDTLKSINLLFKTTL